MLLDCSLINESKYSFLLQPGQLRGQNTNQTPHPLASVVMPTCSAWSWIPSVVRWASPSRNDERVLCYVRSNEGFLRLLKMTPETRSATRGVNTERHGQRDCQGAVGQSRYDSQVAHV